MGQYENGLSERATDQSQSSEQDGQVVSGDYTMLSGNNILCTKGNNLDQLSNSIGNCDLDPMSDDDGVGSGDESGTLYSSSFLRINCSPHGIFVSCPNHDGKIVIEDKTNGELLAVFNPVTYDGRPNQYTVEYPWLTKFLYPLAQRTANIGKQNCQILLIIIIRVVEKGNVHFRIIIMRLILKPIAIYILTYPLISTTVVLRLYVDRISHQSYTPNN